MDNTKWCNGFDIEFRQSLAKETFSYNEYLKFGNSTLSFILVINGEVSFVFICLVFNQSKPNAISFVLVINPNNMLVFISFVFNHSKTNVICFVLVIKQIKPNDIKFKFSI